jgi:exodeoxyribonuclease VII small subunit
MDDGRAGAILSAMAKAVAIEDLFQQVEAAIAALESGDLPLEESLVRYEAGLKAMRQARGVIDRFAARLEELRGDESPSADT